MATGNWTTKMCIDCKFYTRRWFEQKGRCANPMLNRLAGNMGFVVDGNLPLTALEMRKACGEENPLHYEPKQSAWGIRRISEEVFK